MAKSPLPSVGEVLYGSLSHVLEPIAPYFKADPDPRVGDWLLMPSPYPTLILTALYLLIVYLGPKYMEKREAFSLKYFIIVYNFLLVILSAYMFYEFFITTFTNPKFNLWCSPVDTSDDEMSLRLAKVCWWYYFSKLIEFFDTFLFILRKKNSQLSFLHVYHHSTMFSLWWIGARYLPGGCSFFSAFLNSGVHVLMYTYYMLSAIGPQMRKYLWWKKYMTMIQLTQFVMIMCHTAYATYINCNYPSGFGISLVLYMVSHILLFSNFYNKAYNATAKTVKALTPRQEKGDQRHNGRHTKQE